MKRTFIILLLCLPFLVNAQGTQKSTNVIYVMAGGLGDGSSWQSPLGDLQKALKKARAGHSIWVAAGTYLPTSSVDRTISFVIPDGVTLLGGFSGYESNADERDYFTNETILSGNIGQDDIEDNSYTVVITHGVSSQTLIDGFIIEGGNANKKISEGSAHSCGGGWFNDASQTVSSPTIQNCTFKNNTAFYGAGLYNHAVQGESSLTLDGCSFVANVAKFDGGAILNNASNGTGNIIIKYSNFYSNQAYYGSAILNKAEIAGEANPLIKTVTFEENLAYMKGSPIYNYRTGEGIVNPLMQNCISTNNTESIPAPENQPSKMSLQKNSTKSAFKIRSTYRK